MGTSRKADITFFRSGRIDITARVAKALGLDDGDVIDILHFEKERDADEWYLCIYLKKPEHGQYAGKVWRTTKGYMNFRASTTQLTGAILSMFPNKEKVKLCVGKPVFLEHYGTCVPLILRNIPVR